MSDEIVFEDTFTLDTIAGEDFQETRKLICTSLSGDTTKMSFDVKLDEFLSAVPTTEHDSLQLAIVETEKLTEESTRKPWELPPVADPFGYVARGVMYGPPGPDPGTTEAGNLSFRVSCGGLIFILTGPDRKLARLINAQKDKSDVFIMIKK